MAYLASKLNHFKNNGMLIKSIIRSLITSSEQDGVRRIVLNNPKKRNVLSLQMIEDLKKELKRDIDNRNLRCIVISSSSGVFSSGHDLKELRTETGVEQHQKLFTSCTELMMDIQRHPVPVIAEVKGLASAAGCQLVAACDIVIASDKATFSTPGANAGLFCSTPGVAVARTVSRKTAAYMLLTGLPINAQEALMSGLVSKVVPEEQLEEETLKIAQAICSKSYPIIKLGKKFFYSQIEMDVLEAYKAGGDVMVNNLKLKDSQEGIKAFLEKRKPVWSHSDEKCH